MALRNNATRLACADNMVQTTQKLGILCGGDGASLHDTRCTHLASMVLTCTLRRSSAGRGCWR